MRSLTRPRSKTHTRRAAPDLRLHGGEDLVQRRHVRAVPGEDLVGEREALRAHHEGEDHLLAVRAVVPGVAALHAGVGGRQALHVRAGEVVQQHLVLRAEQFPIAGAQVLFQRGLVREEPVEAAVEPVGVHLGGVHPEEIVQGRAPVPAGLDGEFAPGGAEPVDGEEGRDPGPGDIGRLAIQRRRPEGVEAQPLPEGPAEPDVAEGPGAGPADPVQADGDDLSVIGQRSARGEEGELLRLPLRVEDLDRLPPAGGGRTVELAEVADRPLAGPIGGADGLHERPVGVGLPVLRPVIRAQEHRARACHAPRTIRKGVGLHYIGFSRGCSCVLCT